MGNLFCASPEEPKPSATKAEDGAAPTTAVVAGATPAGAAAGAAAAPALPKIDPKSLMCMKLKDQVIFRAPGYVGWPFPDRGTNGCVST
jgi:hypothetical protein